MPQGGVNNGEDLLSALKRELEEETSIKSIKILKELNQSKIIDWKRLKIKLRSDFSVKTSGKNNYELLRNLDVNTIVPIIRCCSTIVIVLVGYLC